jgi:V/A-type H+-transporting ATPase subunit I
MRSFMIVPMKKAAVIVRGLDAEETVRDLRRLGLLHIEHQATPASRELSALEEEITLVRGALAVFSRVIAVAPKQKALLGSWQEIARHVLDLDKRQKQLEAYAQKLGLEISCWQEWGDFEPKEILQLREKGLFAGLYQLPQKQLSEFPPQAVVKVIFKAGGIAHCLVLAGQNLQLPFQEVALPKQGLSQLQQRLVEDRRLMQSLQEEIARLSCFWEELRRLNLELEKEFELRQAIEGMAKQDSLTYIIGYLPVDGLRQLSAVAKQKQWGLVIQEPAAEDNVPTLIRNPAWVNLIKPLFRLLEIIPGYRELDTSALFLVFFSIFFGMIIGDVGYGLVYLLLTFWLQKKLSRRLKDSTIFFFFYALSFCAMIWGLLTGSCFGQEWFLSRGFQPLLPLLNNRQFLQGFCFFLGALHLTLAHLWRMALNFPALTALAEAGWIFILWAGFFLARTLILGKAFPGFGKWLIIAGIGLVILFSSPRRHILRRIGAGLATTALSLMNNFTDVVSYIRLFAVGLAGVAIADTVNTLAQLAGKLNFLAVALVMLLGHSLNVLLGPMSVLVHGVRLNVLEFSSHAGVSWSGKAYKPLKE